MKHFVMYMVLCLLLNTGFSQSEKALLDSAQRLYEREAYDSSLIIYEQFVNEGYTSADLQINLGNIYYKQKKYFEALICYEKALLVNPSSEMAAYNADLARFHISGDVQQTLVNTKSSFWNSWNPGLQGIAIVSLVLIFCIPVLVFWNYKTHRQRIKIITLGLGIFMLCAWGATLTAGFYFHGRSGQSYALVKESSVEVLEKADVTSTVLKKLKPGTRVEMLGSQNGWTKVHPPGTDPGWVPDTTVIVL